MDTIIMYAIYMDTIIMYTINMFDKIRQNPTKSDTSMSKIVDDKKNRSLDKIQQYICI